MNLRREIEDPDRPKMTRNRATQLAGEQGSTLLEFSLIATAFFFLIFGTIDFARALYAYHFVANAAREGVRYTIVRGTSWGSSNPCATPTTSAPPASGCEADASDVQAYVQDMASGIGLSNSPNGAVAIATFLTPGPPPNNPGDMSCATLSGYPVNPGCVAIVTVTYPFTFISPFLPQNVTCIVNGSEVTASICMTSTSQMIVSQ